jgi:hypothetical protein
MYTFSSRTLGATREAAEAGNGCGVRAITTEILGSLNRDDLSLADDAL